MPKQVDLPHITGKVPYEVEQAILRLREAIELHGAQLEAQDATLAALPAPLTLSEIQQALSPSGDYPLPTAGLLNTTPAPTGGGGSPQTPVTVPDHLDIVQSVLASMPLDASSTNEQIFRFAQMVVWQIFNLGTDPPPLEVGLLHQAAGDGVFTCAGVPYATFRICYNNGANIKILTGSYTAQWTQEANVPLDEYRPPTDPSGPC